MSDVAPMDAACHKAPPAALMPDRATRLAQDRYHSPVITAKALRGADNEHAVDARLRAEPRLRRLTARPEAA